MKKKNVSLMSLRSSSFSQCTLNLMTKFFSINLQIHGVRLKKVIWMSSSLSFFNFVSIQNLMNKVVSYLPSTAALGGGEKKLNSTG